MQLILLSQTDSFGVAILSVILVKKCAVKVRMCAFFKSRKEKFRHSADTFSSDSGWYYKLDFTGSD